MELARNLDPKYQWKEGILLSCTAKCYCFLINNIIKNKKNTLNSTLF